MKKSLLIFLGILASLVFAETALRVGGFVWSALESHGERREFSKKSFRILCLGESTTAPTMHPYDHSWPTQLEKILNGSNIGVRFEVLNAGRSGTTTAVLAARLPGLLEKFSPDIVLAMAGINDFYDLGVAAGLKRNSFQNFLNSMRLTKLIKQALPPLNNPVEMSAAARNVPLKENLPSPLKLACRSEFQRMRPRGGDPFACRAALKKDPSDWDSFFHLTRALWASGRRQESEQLLRNAIRKFPDSDGPKFILGKLLARSGEGDQAVDHLYWVAKHSTAPSTASHAFILLSHLNPKRYRGEIASLSKRIMELETGEKTGFLQVKSLGPEIKSISGLSPVSAENLETMRQLAFDHGAQFAVIQYPTLDAAPLRSLFAAHPEVGVLENKNNFAAALKNKPYSDIFIDRFKTNWGHCTEAGNTMIAENAAKMILEALPRHSKMPS